MSDIQFPTKGQFFGVTHASGRDGSYRDDVWECIASDEYRIVANPIQRSSYKNGLTFYRSDWVIEPVSDAVVVALQVAEEQREQDRAKAI